jgi:hypothetical protein
VNLVLNHDAGRLSIPASALIFDQHGLKVATVGQDHKVVLKTITIARDLGKTLEVQSGLTSQDQVIENPPDGVTEGVLVNIAANADASK